MRDLVGPTGLVRRATLEDIAALIDLYREFHEFHVKGVPDRLQRPDEYDTDDLRSKLVDIIEAEDSNIFVTELDGQVIGLAEVYMREDESNPYRISHKYAHLQSIMVSEKCRRKEIGRRLLRAVEQWSKEKDATEVRLDIWEFDNGPLRFYEKEGYRTLRRTMVRKL